MNATYFGENFFPNKTALTRLQREFIGFDDLLNSFFNIEDGNNTSGFPPYNIVQLDESGTRFLLELAVAGFTEDEISVVHERNILAIKGEKTKGQTRTGDNYKYLYKGIAERNFTRSFHLAEHIVVEEAIIRDGLLLVTLTKYVPEELKPKQIPIRKHGN